MATLKKGNNTGEVKGPTKPAAKKADEANPTAKPDKPIEMDPLDALQLALDLVGMIPGAGAVADLLNAAISAYRGDFIGAAFNLFSAVPAIGDGAAAAKIIKNSDKYLQALKVIEAKVLPMLPARLRKKMEDFLAQIRSKIDDLTKKDKPNPKKDEPEGGKTKPKPKPKPDCGKTGPYKASRDGHDNDGINWDHVPSVAALLKAAEKATGKQLSKAAKQAIQDNAPTVAIPTQAHQKESRTYGGRQNSKDVTGEATKNVDSKDLQKATKEDTKKMGDNIEKYDKGCGAAYKKAAKELTKRTHADWEKWLKDIVKEANQGIKK